MAGGSVVLSTVAERVAAEREAQGLPVVPVVPVEVRARMARVLARVVADRAAKGVA
ncbi:MAG: hypothetical protein Q7V57_11060 [Actinomycetota bacterium]|nr:hypothetical protein [Actinomycetota bacterium]